MPRICAENFDFGEAESRCLMTIGNGTTFALSREEATDHTQHEEIIMIRWLAILSPLIVATSTSAHDWYPWECCSGIDCAPVDHVNGGALDMVVT